MKRLAMLIFVACAGFAGATPIDYSGWPCLPQNYSFTIFCDSVDYEYTVDDPSFAISQSPSVGSVGAGWTSANASMGVFNYWQGDWHIRIVGENLPEYGPPGFFMTWKAYEPDVYPFFTLSEMPDGPWDFEGEVRYTSVSAVTGKYFTWILGIRIVVNAPCSIGPPPDCEAIKAAGPPSGPPTCPDDRGVWRWSPEWCRYVWSSWYRNVSTPPVYAGGPSGYWSLEYGSCAPCSEDFPDVPGWCWIGEGYPPNTIYNVYPAPPPVGTDYVPGEGPPSDVEVYTPPVPPDSETVYDPTPGGDDDPVNQVPPAGTEEWGLWTYDLLNNELNELNQELNDVHDSLTSVGTGIVEGVAGLTTLLDDAFAVQEDFTAPAGYEEFLSATETETSQQLIELEGAEMITQTTPNALEHVAEYDLGSHNNIAFFNIAPSKIYSFQWTMKPAHGQMITRSVDWSGPPWRPWVDLVRACLLMGMALRFWLLIQAEVKATVGG